MVNPNNLRRRPGTEVSSNNILEVVAEISTNRALTIAAERTRQEIAAFFKRSAESELETDEFRISLVDPISRMRIRIPVRSVECSHFQCFDLYNFLEINTKNGNNDNKGGSWRCPHCQAMAKREQLRVDGYFQEMLLRPEPLEVALLPDGSWEEVQQLEFKDVLENDGNDDIVEIVAKKKKNNKPIENPAFVNAQQVDLLCSNVIDHESPLRNALCKILDISSNNKNNEDILDALQKMKQKAEMVKNLEAQLAIVEGKLGIANFYFNFFTKKEIKETIEKLQKEREENSLSRSHADNDDILPVNIVQLSLGFAGSNGQMIVVIEQGAKIPVTAIRNIQLKYGDSIRVYEGERYLASQNTLLGGIPVNGCYYGRDSKVEIKFKIDHLGTFQVEAKIDGRLEKKEITLLNVKNRRITYQQIGRLMAEADQYRSVDEGEVNRLFAKNRFESCYENIKTRLITARSFQTIAKTQLLPECQKILRRCHEAPTEEEYTRQHAELMKIGWQIQEIKSAKRQKI